eukprot:TRINITY_DN4551_c0_g1_i1.p1 TRINITY_DN4551_c0_g1~~TRINITY_DN4551_c0_g1_i1.p1  ORF type:complete len:404 (-),score=50.42 TRINITY_DN4551_c0_g1_i1:464-1519(-)
MDGSEEEEIPMEYDDVEKPMSYEVISEKEMMKESKKMIEGVMEFLAIPNRALAACLLRCYKWNRQALIEDYLSQSEKALAKAGLSSLELETPIEDPNKVSECLVCMEDYKNKNSFALACGHRYCRSCWRQYLQVAIDEGAECITKNCMAPGCKCVVHEEAYKKILSAARLKKYQKFLLRSFVEDNPKVKWCPAPDCNACIRCERKNRTEAVRCKCGFGFCFQCADYDVGEHMPASCNQVDEWEKKAADESENVTWMIANTKKCPECRSPIEKNGGCMHMTCRKNAGGCGHEFCWLCRARGQNMAHTLAVTTLATSMTFLLPKRKMSRQPMRKQSWNITCFITIASNRTKGR